MRGAAVRVTTISILVLTLAATQAGAASRNGTEFRVNTYTTGEQKASVVAVDDDGDFVVAWTSEGQDGQSWGPFGQRFASSGLPLGAEFMVNTYTYTFQQYLAAALDPDGDFVIAWTSYRQDGLNSGIFAQRFASSGAPVGTDFQINVITVTVQSYPSIAMEDNGDFAVVWQSSPILTGTGFKIFARLFTSSGDASSGELQVSTYTGSSQKWPAAAADADGDFVVAWTSSAPDGSVTGDVFMQRFSSSGARVGADFRVNTYTLDYQLKPAVGMDADGDFVVAWTSYNQDGSSRGVFGRRFSSAGVAASPFQINRRTTGSQRDPTVAMESSGHFVVAWTGENQDGFGYGIFARQFTRSGAALGTEFQVNTVTADNQTDPTVAIDAGGDFVLAWTGGQQDGFEPGDTGVFGQRFAAPALDVDGDGTAEPLTDGVLILRRLFNFGGAPLVLGAVDLVDCSRCTAPAIEQYIAQLGMQLDVDGDGQLEALTDGLLIERWLFGFTGAPLTSGAVDLAHCTRCNSTAIATYLTPLSR